MMFGGELKAGYRSFHDLALLFEGSIEYNLVCECQIFNP